MSGEIPAELIVGCDDLMERRRFGCCHLCIDSIESMGLLFVIMFYEFFLLPNLSNQIEKMCYKSKNFHYNRIFLGIDFFNIVDLWAEKEKKNDHFFLFLSFFC